jgi:predicted nuclease of predicted toxin-antitoxin system
MRILLDEDTPAQLADPLRRVLVGHDIDEIRAIGWSGKKDPQVLRDAGRAGYRVRRTGAADGCVLG